MVRPHSRTFLHCSVVLAGLHSPLEGKHVSLFLEMKSTSLSGGPTTGFSPPPFPFSVSQVLAAAFVPQLHMAQDARELHSASPPSPTLLPPGSVVCGVLCYPPLCSLETCCPTSGLGPALDIGFLLPLFFLTGLGGFRVALLS